MREDEEPSESGPSWEDRLARNYESKLFKEYALIDLKHYKSKKFALRWRTATEVVGGVGEETCGSLRCEYHSRAEGVRLRSFELPFAYEEAGARKETVVKVRLCGRCARKLRWEPGGREGEEKERQRTYDKDDTDRRESKRRREDAVKNSK